MKIRNGYVSNSSTSSFCVLGIKYSDYKNKCDNYDFVLTDLIIDEFSGIYNYYGETIIGAVPQRMIEDETLLQFKQRICDDLKKIGINVTTNDLKWFIDGGYDG